MAVLRLVSGIGGKAPACFLVEATGARLLLDLGQGPDAGRLPDIGRLGRVDAVLLTHAHVDHAGGLGLLPLIGNPPVYATDVVAALIPHAGIRPLPLHGTTEIAGITVATGRDGHAPGGVWLHLDIGGGLLYAGDVSLESGLYAFDPPPAARTAILDASYGAADTPQAERMAALAPLLDGGPVLFPAPAGGRGPELALHALGATGHAPALCAATRAMVDLLADRWRHVLRDGAAERLAALLRQARPIGAEPYGVMIAAKPNADDGESARLAAAWRDRAEPAIVFTGHVADGSPAAALCASGRAVWRRWNVHPRLSDNVALADRIGARVVVPAFGGRGDEAAWRQAFAPAEVVLDGPVDLSP